MTGLTGTDQRGTAGPAASLSSTFEVLANPTRRRVLELLSEGELSVSELLRGVDKSQSALSQHLAVLRGAGLVAPRRDGRRRLYRLQIRPLAEAVEWFVYFGGFWDDKLEALGKHLEKRR
jgi:DNA-binding transcriptional ArsR family regulator